MSQSVMLTSLFCHTMSYILCHHLCQSLPWNYLSSSFLICSHWSWWCVRYSGQEVEDAVQRNMEHVENRRSTPVNTTCDMETWTCFIMFPCACVVYCHNLSHFHNFPHFLWEVAWSLQVLADTLQEGRLQNSHWPHLAELKNSISDFKEVKTKHHKAPSFWTFLDKAP